MNFEILNFTIFCVNNVALRLNQSAKEMYHNMQRANIINGYVSENPKKEQFKCFPLLC